MAKHSSHESVMAKQYTKGFKDGVLSTRDLFIDLSKVEDFLERLDMVEKQVQELEDKVSNFLEGNAE